jgi:hypothetical protein
MALHLLLSPKNHPTEDSSISISLFLNNCCPLIHVSPDRSLGQPDEIRTTYMLESFTEKTSYQGTLSQDIPKAS